jgi:hypothetical protein
VLILAFGYKNNLAPLRQKSLLLLIMLTRHEQINNEGFEITIIDGGREN